ncbi:hypothetical protein DOY81_006958 [Sarcophaga bullata]|nr:hypothetical protein DOY81_006958 [Sarcophaga bullata]
MPFKALKNTVFVFIDQQLLQRIVLKKEKQRIKNRKQNKKNLQNTKQNAIQQTNVI